MDKKSFIEQLNLQSYQVIAEFFDQTRRKFPGKEVNYLGSYVQAGDSIVDLGCGNGRLLNALPKVNFQYLGIDSNNFFLQQAKKEFPQHKFELCNLQTVSLQSNAFDKIFMVAVFHHLITRAERLKLLKEIQQSLKPEGLLLMTNWNLWQKRYVKYWLQHLTKKIAWNDFFIPWYSNRDGRLLATRYYHSFTRGELGRLLSEAGFEVQSQRKFRGNIITIAKRPV